MKLTLLQILIAVAVLAMLAALILPAFAQRGKVNHRHRVRKFTMLEKLALPFVAALDRFSCWPQRVLGSGNRIVLANTIPVRDGCRATRLADAAIGRFRVLKKGSDGYHVDVCGVADIPLGITEDNSAGAAEDEISYAVFGLAHESKEGIASGAIADGDYLVPGAAGTIKTLPVAQGTYYIIGRYNGPAVADTKPFAFIPSFPVQRVVA
jgi:hypothetical protein